MPIPDRIERTIDLAQPPQRVWEALTSAEGLGGWFGYRATVDLRPGGTAYVEWDGEDHKATLTISVVDPPTRFAWTWGIQGLPATDPRRTYVEFTLAPGGGGIRLTVVESGFAQVPDELLDTAYPGNVRGWRKELPSSPTTSCRGGTRGRPPEGLRPDRARTPGGLGGLARGLPPRPRHTHGGNGTTNIDGGTDGASAACARALRRHDER